MQANSYAFYFGSERFNLFIGDCKDCKKIKLVKSSQLKTIKFYWFPIVLVDLCIGGSKGFALGWPRCCHVLGFDTPQHESNAV